MPSKKEDVLLVSRKNGVATLCMNRPKQLNGWTEPMMASIKETLYRLGIDSDTKVAVLTGKDPYYCAGVNLSGTIQMMHPKSLHGMIVKHNAAIFDAFIEFPKPILIAANGPAIGACVTSATLCDEIIASEKATFSTPFAKLGIVPEGCSSIHFERIMGPENAQRMLGPEGWIPNAEEALEVGIVQEVVPHDQLMDRAQAKAEQWIKDKKIRSFIEQNRVQEYKRVNLKESYDLADAFLAPPFLNAQYKFLKSKGKIVPAYTFWFLKTTRPLWDTSPINKDGTSDKSNPTHITSAWRTSKLLSTKKPPEVIIQEDLNDMWDLNDPNNLSSMERDLDDLYDRLPSPSHETLAEPHSPISKMFNRGSRHSSAFPVIAEEDELATPYTSTTPRYSIGSLGPNFNHKTSHRNSNSSVNNNFGTLPRGKMINYMRTSSSEERINQLTRLVFLNEDTLTRNPTSTERRESKRYSLDHFLTNFLHSPSAASADLASSDNEKSNKRSGLPSYFNYPNSTNINNGKNKKRENSVNSLTSSSSVATLNQLDSQSTISSMSSLSSMASDITIKAEPIYQSSNNNNNKKYKKNRKKMSENNYPGKNDTLKIYQRKRRTGVHFSTMTNEADSSMDSSYV